jgi:hypothetical protein
MKKFVSIFLSCVLLIALSTTVGAAEVPSVSSPIYEEKGQVIFDSVKLENEDGKVKIQANSNFEQAQQLAPKLKDPSIQKILSKYIAQGKTPVAIGWTKVYLKVSEDSKNETAEVPMTITDMKKLSNDDSDGKTVEPLTQKGNFTLYTLVGYDNYDPLMLYGESIGEWNDGSYGNNGPASDNDDFITISWPDGCILLSSTVLGDYTGSYENDEAYSSVVWGFGEEDGTVTLLSDGRDEGGSGTRKWISKYVHTWQNTIPSFSFTTSGVGITLTNSSASWQLSSSVIF